MMSILSFLFTLFLAAVVFIVALVLIGLSRMRAMLGGKKQRGSFQQTGRNPFGSQEGQEQGRSQGAQKMDGQRRQESTYTDNYSSQGPHEKVFSQTEGEYVDFEEIQE